MSKNYNALLISDFNIEVLQGYLSNDDTSPQITATTAPFGQVMGALLDKTHPCWQGPYDFAVIWTQPEKIIPSFHDVLDFKSVPVEKILSQVDDFGRALTNLGGQPHIIFIPSWVVPTHYKTYTLEDMKEGVGLNHLLMRMNLRLAEHLSKTLNMYLLNTQKWVELVGPQAFNPKLWYMGKIPLDTSVFAHAAYDIKSALRALAGDAKKVVMLDLDETLWAGRVEEVGWENLTLGGHDPIGEALLDFQLTLKSLKHRGILLGIISDNEETVALEVMDKHPEMALHREDFSGWRINREDKVKNIKDLAAELKCDLASVVFLHNKADVCVQIQEALPEVLVVNLPQDQMLYKKTLLGLSCFDAPSMSPEDFSKFNVI